MIVVINTKIMNSNELLTWKAQEINISLEKII